MKTITILEHKNGNVKVSYGDTIREENDVRLLDGSRQLTLQISDDVFEIISKSDKWGDVCREILEEN